MEIGKINIPETPGVYLMKKKNKVIYVGKAKNLKKRVLSYFNKDLDSLKSKELVKNIEDIEFIICKNEVDALILENNLIKKYLPKYNILLKDQKTYPYIKITKEEFPKISLIRTRKFLDTKSGEYFGPYPYGGKNLMKNIIKMFKIRDCNRNMDKFYKRPCLKFYMKTCLGPCVDKTILKEYTDMVDSAKQILKGDVKKLVSELNKKMKEASDEMDFDKAIVYRNQLKELGSLKDEQIIEYGKDLDEDIFTYKVLSNKAFTCVLNVRKGKIIGKISNIFDLKDKIYDKILDEIIMSFYSIYPIPNGIVISDSENLSEETKEAINIIKKSNVTFYFPKIKSRRKELLEMATLNLEKDISNYFSKKIVVEDGIKKLHDVMKLKKFPLKIECFDISNIQGKDAVASMSVSVEGKPSKKDYRRFKIMVKDTPDDFEMMREVIRRRYEKLDIKDFPDAILIDGGLGQINAAAEVLKAIGKLEFVDLLSLAKKEELVYKFGNNVPFSFSKDEEGLKILQRVRDEAHRFAITYHRKLRSKRVISSELDNIKGIGNKRKMDLLRHFGSVKKIAESDMAEIEKIVPKNIALEIKNNLKNK